MSAGEPDERRLEQIVEVYDGPEKPDATAPSPARALGAAGVVVAVVAAVLAGLPLVAAGLLLVALTVAVATAPVDVTDAGSEIVRPVRSGRGLLDGVRDRLERVRDGFSGDRG